MKFISAAITALAALASFSEAKRATKSALEQEQWKQELNHRMKNNLYDKEFLMKHAQPHNDAAKQKDAKRVLNDFQITASYSIKFISCFSMSTSYDELFENNNQNNGGMTLSMWKNGNIIAERSYAIFELCYSSQCDYADGDPTMEYTIDLQTYVQALVLYLPDQVEQFCEGCQENEDACYAQLYGGYGYSGQYGNGGQAYGNGYQQQNAYGQYQQQNGGNRKLSDIVGQDTRRTNENAMVRQLDCNMCLQYNCIQGQNNNNNNNWNEQYGFDAAAEWLTEIAQCYQTNAYYGGGYGNNGGGGQNNALYAGFICNDEGTGVEIGMFMDEECVLYLPNEPASNYMNYFDQTYQEMTADIIEFTFSNAKFGCASEEITYTTYDVSGYNQYYQYQNAQNWNGEEGEAAEWCTYLYDNELGTTPVNMYNCGGSGNNNYYSKYQNYGNDNSYSSTYSWYTYDMSEDYALDMSQVCQAVKKANGELHTYYNPNNGHMYSYGSNSNSNQAEDFLDETGNTSVSKSSTKKDLTGAAKFGIVALVGVVVGAVLAIALKVRSNMSEKKEPLMSGEIEENDGQMA